MYIVNADILQKLLLLLTGGPGSLALVDLLVANRTDTVDSSDVSGR